MVRAGALTGLQAEAATLTALAAAVVLVGASVWAGLLSARLPMSGSVLLALAVTACGLLFGAVGALTAQLFSPRRRATQIAMVTLGVSFAVRVIADGTRGLGWLRWCTPFGWAEQTHAFTGNVWWPVILVLAAGAVAAAAAVSLQRRRDMGAGALFADRRAHSRLTLLGSPARFALRSEISTVLVWTASLGAYAVIVGLLAKDFSSFVSTSRGFQDVAARLATTTLTRPEGFLALIFTFFAPPVALMGVFQVGAARTEESAGRAEIVLATAVPRWRWLLGRVGVGRAPRSKAAA
jgi:ABC-2 type transport system permease protein